MFLVFKALCSLVFWFMLAGYAVGYFFPDQLLRGCDQVTSWLLKDVRPEARRALESQQPSVEQSLFITASMVLLFLFTGAVTFGVIL